MGKICGGAVAIGFDELELEVEPKFGLELACGGIFEFEKNFSQPSS